MGLGEADTRAKLVDPALHSRGWTEDLIRREETAGAIDIVDGRPRKRPKGRVDYVLRVRINLGTQPVAVALIEAKAEDLPPTHGLEQAKLYGACKRLNIPFVFSSNGHLFVEYDRSSGLTSAAKPLGQFPSPEELQARYEAAVGFRLADPAARPLLMPYPGGEATRRYYQDAAIRAALEKIARATITAPVEDVRQRIADGAFEKMKGKKRVLLSLATGSGKTFIAVRLLKKIADAGQLKRALFVCDRDELRSQAKIAFQGVFGADAADVSTDNPQKNARILIATYQTLGVDTEDADANFLIQNYPENYFSHIVIDECHRSAWGRWSLVLTRNPDAVQIGLTATPRQLKVTEKTREALADAEINADNLRYFGEPAYEYEMSQGIEDGYLAACEIQRGRVNLDDTGITIEDILARGAKDATTGEMVAEEDLRHLYQATDYEDQILLPDRVLAMCQDLFSYFLDTGGPEQKSIIFCVRDRHADDVAGAMNNLYARWCQQNGRKHAEPYAFKCTAASGGGDYLGDLRGASRHHFIATTVELLTTGVDVPCVQNIVFFKYVRSPLAFYQMVGRGTRLYAPTNKLMFRVYDYTNATRLFGEDFVTIVRPPRERPPEPPPPPERIIQVEGFDVHITDAGRYILTHIEGRAMPVTIEEYKQRLAERLVEEAPTLEAFRQRWITPEERRQLMAHLPEAGRSAIIVRALEEMTAYDLYDVLGELGYGMVPRTREERADAFTYKHSDWLSELPAETRATLRALVAQFARAGTEGLENLHVFQTPEVTRAGGLAALRALGEPREILHETKERVFAA
jgi:type I restriction enzyme R subunit